MNKKLLLFFISLFVFGMISQLDARGGGHGGHGGGHHGGGHHGGHHGGGHHGGHHGGQGHHGGHGGRGYGRGGWGGGWGGWGWGWAPWVGIGWGAGLSTAYIAGNNGAEPVEVTVRVVNDTNQTITVDGQSIPPRGSITTDSNTFKVQNDAGGREFNVGDHSDVRVIPQGEGLTVIPE